jgi:hypothetical protein
MFDGIPRCSTLEVLGDCITNRSMEALVTQDEEKHE